ncbi:MAG: heparan-alpha-glucosaminide N-acetyltransferase [Eubacteriales bacterium]|nr:heparan-alpha-glucosaminide N-acetyltransferase [Eubacteriales bacterium]
MKSERKRIYLLDELRGFAILCMIVHHTFLDVGDVLGLPWGYKVFDALCTVQPVFWAIFIVISGICSRLSRNTVKRGFIVLCGGLIISLVTAVIMPLMGFYGAEIYFGILHCLGSCMIITGLLMPLIEKIDYRVGAVISLALFFFTNGINNHTMLFGLINLPESWYQYDFLAPIGLYSDSFKSADYFSLIPWFFMFLFGAFLGKVAKDEKLPKFMYKQRSKLLCFVGRNSLWVYLLHQPAIYAVMLVIAFIIA